MQQRAGSLASDIRHPTERREPVRRLVSLQRANSGLSKVKIVDSAALTHPWIRQSANGKWYVNFHNLNRGIMNLFSDGQWRVATPDERQSGGYFNSACEAERLLLQVGLPGDADFYQRDELVLALREEIRKLREQVAT